MAAINQRISNFLGGVSQQSDTLKFPGQLRVCDNAYPDVTYGLTKRPPGELVKKLDNVTSGGYYYEIIRQKDAKYLIQITPGSSAGTIKAWDLSDGTEITVNTSGSNPLNYLKQASGSETPYAVQTIQDTTIIANPLEPTGKTGTSPGLLDSGNYGFARMDTIAYNTEYVLYTGTAPTPNIMRRVTAVKVKTKAGGQTINNESIPEGKQTWDMKRDGAGDYSDTGDGDANVGEIQQQSYSGNKEWGSGVDDDGNEGGYANSDAKRAATGHLTVNAHSYIYQQEKTWDDDVDGGSGGDDVGGRRASNFLGYVARYKTRYTASVTLTNGGRYKGGSDGNGLNVDDKIDEVSIEGVLYEIFCAAYEEFSTYETNEDNENYSYYRTPDHPDQGNLSMAIMLKKINDRVNEKLSNVSSTVIGNGLYLTGTKADEVNFLGGTLNEGMTVINRTCVDVSRLPAQCRNGYVVRISNSENTESDNYYLKFETDSNENIGPGKWVECARPNGLNFAGDSDPQDNGLDSDKMPHQLVSTVNTAGKITSFTFKKIDSGNTEGKTVEWKDRQVGDMKTNPMPSFVGEKISKIFFHRNRLAFVADEQIVLSQPGDYFNFFSVSAITYTDNNPIDIAMSDIRPAFIRHILPVQKGIMLFSDTAQFLLFTESDIYSSKTVRLKKMSDYECDSSIRPIDLGTTVMWASTVGPYTRAFEAAIIDDGSPPKVIEQTRVIPELIPSDVTIAACSPAVGLVTYGKKGDNSLYIYKYFDGPDNQRAQSAWFTWTLAGELQHATFTSGNLYTVTKNNNNEYILSRHEFVTNRLEPGTTNNQAYKIGDETPSNLNNSRWFEPCLDYMKYHAPSSTGTTLDVGFDAASDTNVYLVALGGNDVASSNDVIGTITITHAGSDYITAPTVRIDAPPSVTGNIQATATCTIDAEGKVDSVTITHAGKGYANTPSMSFDGGGVGGANAADRATGTITKGHPVAGTVIKGTTGDGSTVNFGQDLNGWKVVTGYSYNTLVEFPIFYPALGDNRDLNGELRISGINFEMGVSGPMEFHVSSIYKDTDPYIQYYSGIQLGTSDFTEPPSELNKSVRVPIQRKNDKYKLQLKIPDPFSTSLISASWDGRYNTKRHVRK